MKLVQTGLSFSKDFHPTQAELASAIENDGVDVVSTIAIILYFEFACDRLVSPYHEANEVTVGTRVEVNHVAPAYPGNPISVTATLEKHERRRLEFDVVAKQGEAVIMTGKHHRAVMNKERFSAQESDNHREAKSIEFWFDFHSPWCYFASHQIGQIARDYGASLNWQPVHLANLSKSIDGRRPLESNPEFVSWYRQDLQDTACMMGVPFEQHHEYPIRPSRALRASIYAHEQKLAEPFVQTLLKGYWSEQLDISDLDVLKKVGKQVGLDADAIKSAAVATEYKQKLESNLETAINKKLFGLPAAIVDEKIFWGNDRLDLLKHYLSGKQPTLKE